MSRTTSRARTTRTVDGNAWHRVRDADLEIWSMPDPYSTHEVRAYRAHGTEAWRRVVHRDGEIVAAASIPSTTRTAVSSVLRAAMAGERVS